jgi:hypothetical protein
MFHSKPGYSHINKRDEEDHDERDVIQNDGRALVLVPVYVQSTDNQQYHPNANLHRTT